MNEFRPMVRRETHAIIRDAGPAGSVFHHVVTFADRSPPLWRRALRAVSHFLTMRI